MKCYTSVSHGEFYQRTRFHAITLAQLKATMQNLFLARTRYVPIHSKMQPGSDPTASCSFSFSRFLFDAASSDVVHPAFLHISQSYSSLPLKTFPQWPDLCVFFSRYLSLNEPLQATSGYKACMDCICMHVSDTISPWFTNTIELCLYELCLYVGR